MLIAALACCLAAEAACSASQRNGNAAEPVPSGVRAACGHPASAASLERLPVTVRHRECDLTGVEVRYGMTGVTVPSSGMVAANADGISSSTTLIAEVDPTTGDVTFQG